MDILAFFFFPYLILQVFTRRKRGVCLGSVDWRSLAGMNLSRWASQPGASGLSGAQVCVWGEQVSIQPWRR